MDCQISENDRVSELPLFLLHRIMSYLPRKDAARTCVLSRRWNSVWNSFPILRFEGTDYIKETRDMPGFAEKFEKFLNLVDESLRKFTQNKLRVEVLNLRMNLIDDKSFPTVDTWIPLALHNGASHIRFWVNTHVRGPNANYYHLPETTFAVKPNPGSSPFYHLQNLCLNKIYLSESIIRDIIHNCPNITDLQLWYFHGLKALELSKLEKLKRLYIGVAKNVREIERVTVDAPCLEDFTFLSYEENLPCVIQLTSSYALKYLRLSNCTITDEWLNSFLYRSPLIEHLILIKCNMLRNIRISAHWLKSLELQELGELEMVQIHAPNLSKFECHTRKNMPILLSEDVMPCSIKITHSLRGTNGPVDSFWFLKLREFLQVSAQGVHFTLYNLDNKVSFDVEALSDVAMPPLVNVDLLELKFGEVRANCADLIDGLLWSCHPKAISFGDPLNQRNCIKVLCEKLYGNEHPLCYESQLKRWHHSLKSVKIESFGGIEVDQLIDLNFSLDSLSLLGKCQVRFILDWGFEDIKK